MELCAGTLKIPLIERRISLAEFYAADEVFTTGTMGELTPVRDIDGRPIGRRVNGEELDFPILVKIQKAYTALTREHLLVPLYC